jgi:hypothetical protein
MVATTRQNARQTNLVASAARALTLANDAALAQGTDPADSRVTIVEESSATGGVWRIHYGPTENIGRRCGDTIVLVEESDAVQKVIRRAVGAQDSLLRTSRLRR